MRFLAPILLYGVLIAAPALAQNRLNDALNEVEGVLDGKPKTEQAAPAPGSFGPFNYGDWEVRAGRQANGAIDCLAFTTDGQENTLRMEHETDSEFGYPVVYYLHVELLDRHEPLLGNGDELTFRFDDGSELAGTAEDISPLDIGGNAYTAADGFPYNNEKALFAMKERDTLTIIRDFDGMILFQASLKGLTASYGKMIEICGAAPL